MRSHSLLAVLLLTGCASHSLEVGRPLVVAAIPTEGTRLEEIREHFPNTDLRALTDSMAYSRSARNRFDIHKHNDWTSFAPIRRLVQAIDLVPDNPFAWVQLGAYLALNHQLQAAIMATWHGLELSEEKCAIHGCTDDLEKLRNTAAINIATYATDAERPLEGLLALERITWWNLPPFEQLAYHWTAVSARTALGDFAGAREDLLNARAIAESELMAPSTIRLDYPQYFGKYRRAIELYLDAVIDHSAGNLACAEESLREALRHDPELWNAHLLLANIHYTRAEYKECIAILGRVIATKRSSHDMFRPERIAYNLGNAYLARYDAEHGKSDLEAEHDMSDLEAARAAFAEAARTVERRFKTEQKRAELAGVFEEPEGDASFSTLSPRLRRSTPMRATTSAPCTNVLRARPPTRASAIIGSPRPKGNGAARCAMRIGQGAIWRTEIWPVSMRTPAASPRPRRPPMPRSMPTLSTSRLSGRCSIFSNDRPDPIFRSRRLKSPDD